MGNPHHTVPVKLAMQLRRLHQSDGSKYTWKAVATELKRMGYPPDPYLPFGPAAVQNAISRHKSRHENGYKGFT